MVKLRCVRNVLLKRISVTRAVKYTTNPSMLNPSARVLPVHGRSNFVRFSVLKAYQELY